MLVSVLLGIAPPIEAAQGRVVDAGTGRPIAGAEVTIVGAPGSVRTGADGRFIWPDLPPPPVVFVVLLADGRVGRPIRVTAADAALELRLEVDAGLGEAVTVRGVAPGIDLAPGTSGVVITASDVFLRSPATLAQALEFVPGVSAISEGQGATPAIRGLARGRSVILLDGARVSSERGAGPNGAFLDPATLARIDIARGPGSVAYGSDAFGGVIAARSRLPDPAAGFGVRFAATAGTGVPERRVNVDISRGYGQGALAIGGRWREYEEYESPDGVVPHSGWRDSGARMHWTHTLGATRVFAGWQRDEARDIGRPRNDSNTVVASTPFEKSDRLTVSVERPTLLGWRDVRLHAFAGHAEHRNEQDRLPAPGRPRRVDRADGSASDVQIRLTGRRNSGPVRLHAGADIQGRFGVSATDSAFAYNAAGTLASTIVTASIHNAKRTVTGLFVEADAAIGSRMRVTGGLRGDATRTVNEGGFYGDRSNRNGAVAGVLALAVTPARGLTVVSQFARGFREPTLTDRFSRGPVGRGFIEGNPDLEPETSRQFDVTTRYRAGRFELSGALYRYDIRQLIERYNAGVDLFRLRNRGQAILQGAEIDARFEVTSNLSVEMLAQASRGRDAVDGTPLDDVAPRSVGFILRHSWRQRLSAYVRVTGTARHDRSGPGEVATPGYTLVDAAAVWRVSPMLDVRLTVRNLTDASYYSSAGPRWVWAPGRQAVVTIEVRRRRD